MTETAPYEPRVKAYEPTQYAQAASRVSLALQVAEDYRLAPEVRALLTGLHATMEAEPEASLLASDFRYMQARTDTVADSIRKYFHPSNPAVLEHLAGARENLKSAYATWKITPTVA